MSIAEPVPFKESAPGRTSGIPRVVLSSIIGTAVEWYDFLIYATASALVFNKLFFPQVDPAVGTIAAFGTYGVGYFARPLGAAIFGHFGDRYGRKAMLAMTIIIMGLGTFLIGLLPTYDDIGYAAPVLLVVLRLLQGIGLGGEWGGAVLMVLENAPPGRRGRLASLVQIGYPAGNLAAVFAISVASSQSEADFLGWAWRIPFLVSILLAGVGLYIRLTLEETPAFREIAARREVAELPIAEVLTAHRREFLTAVGLKLSEISYATIIGVFAISYVEKTLGLPRSLILNAILLASAAGFVVIPVFGWLSDLVGRKALFYAASVFAVAFAFPLFSLLDTRDPLTITLTVVAALVFGQFIGFGVGASWYSEMFAARMRYSGASLGFQIGAAISGGLTPFAAAAFMTSTGGATWPISVYLVVLAAITFIATTVAPETAGKPLK